MRHARDPTSRIVALLSLLLAVSTPRHAAGQSADTAQPEAQTQTLPVAPTSAQPGPDNNPTLDAVVEQGPAEEGDQEYNGEDLTRPQNSVDLRLRYQTASGATKETMLLRANTRINLDADWKLAVLAQIPAVRNTIATLNPAATDREFGVGDTAFQAALIDTIDKSWAFGFGARLVAPTAEDRLGSGKWQIMPGFGVRYMLPGLGPDSYFVPAIRYAMSFAGDPSRRNISQPQIAPTLNIGLADRCFVTFYPSYDIRINYGGPVSGQTGRLFLPLDVAVGRKVFDNLVIARGERADDQGLSGL